VGLEVGQGLQGWQVGQCGQITTGHGWQMEGQLGQLRHLGLISSSAVNHFSVVVINNAAWVFQIASLHLLRSRPSKLNQVLRHWIHLGPGQHSTATMAAITRAEIDSIYD
jgi:hypothetical protein